MKVVVSILTGNLLAQVLGFVGTDDKGLDGLEMQMDDTLRGGTTKELIATDSHGTANFWLCIIAVFCRKKKKSITLTIDTTVQFIAERALDKAMADTKATGASIIVMDPKTGEIFGNG